MLGVESWLSKFYHPSLAWNQLQPVAAQAELVRSLHFVTGALLFATSVAVTLLAHRRTGWAVRTVPQPASRLEGAA